MEVPIQVSYTLFLQPSFASWFTTLFAERRTCWTFTSSKSRKRALMSSTSGPWTHRSTSSVSSFFTEPKQSDSTTTFIVPTSWACAIVARQAKSSACSGSVVEGKNSFFLHERLFCQADRMHVCAYCQCGASNPQMFFSIELVMVI
jgi:hypothetical protein